MRSVLVALLAFLAVPVSAQTLHLRHQHPTKTVAFTAWQMPNDTLRVVHVTQAAYDTSTRLPDADMPGRPSLGARFLFGAGGISALDTPTGWPSRGDCWEDTDPVTGETVLRIALAVEPEWSYTHEKADDPVDNLSRTTILQGGTLRSRATLRRGQYDLQHLDQLRFPARRVTSYVGTRHGQIPNHHSVSFDVAGSGTATAATSITFSVTVAVQSNRYVAGASVNASGQTLSTVTYNAVGLTSRITCFTSGTTCSDASPNQREYYFDLVNNSTGAHNAVFTYSAKTTGVAGLWSLYGVDQSTPRSSTGSTAGASTAPFITIASATGEIVLTMIGNTATVPLTVDATWTSDWNAISTNAGAGAHLAGAASVTRTDTQSTTQWGAVGASIKAVASSCVPTLTLLGVSRC